MIRQGVLFSPTGPCIPAEELEEELLLMQLEVGGVLDRDPRWERPIGRRRVEIIDSDKLNGG